MKRLTRRQTHFTSAVMFALFFIVAFLYFLVKNRIELEEQFMAEADEAYEETIKTKVVDKFSNKGYQKGYTAANLDDKTLKEKQEAEKHLLDIKQKALGELESYDREKVCQIAYRAGVARGEADAKKNWSVEYWDEKTGVSLGKILSFGKKVVRLQLKYRHFPVGAPVETDVEKEVEVDHSVVCGLLKGLQWSNPASYQFIESVKEEVCGSKRMEKGEIITEEEANNKFWDSLP